MDAMDRPIRKKHWIIRYKYYLIGGVVFTAFLIYLLIVSAGPRKLRSDKDRLEIAEVMADKFMEYQDVEGIVQPKLTIKLNSNESGIVKEIVAEDGSMLEAGDVILVLSNPELERTIQDEWDELQKIRLSYREKEIFMEQKIADLKRQNMETLYDLNRLTREQGLNEEEYKIGMKSKAQYELATEEFRFKTEKTRMLQEGITRDSLMNNIQNGLQQDDLARAEKRFERSRERLENLIIRAPVNGQLSFINAIPGERIGAGSSIGDFKVVDQIKISTRISEYYIDRVALGLPATIDYQGTKYALKITRVNPEIRDRQFEVDLSFVDDQIENIRIGKSYRVQIELEQPEEALVMKKGNFFQTTGGQWIFKLNASGDKAVRTSISIGRQNPRQYEVLDGLAPGDKVIITGYDNFGEAQEIILK